MPNLGRTSMFELGDGTLGVKSVPFNSDGTEKTDPPEVSLEESQFDQLIFGINPDLYAVVDEAVALGSYSVNSFSGVGDSDEEVFTIVVPEGYLVHIKSNLVSVVTTNTQEGTFEVDRAIQGEVDTTGTELVQVNEITHAVDPSPVTSWRLGDTYSNEEVMLKTLLIPFDATSQGNQRISFNTAESYYGEGTHIFRIITTDGLETNYSIGSFKYNLYAVTPK